ncbi:Sds3-like domain-containing protein [Paramicrosporidium saccamoebae]|uniref:Sds3-like domain-containing protein n=1 Tax=Paramicrosporidium saccamoebae TaxID=1246581 RepID=A0A2H9TMJ0_9FUNG|nr:Sds3-like domain-containing protein [Paramicrosporidium saccamoebae]
MNIINLGIKADKPSTTTNGATFGNFGNYDLTDNTTGVVDPMETNGTPSQYSKLVEHTNDSSVLGSPNLPVEEPFEIPDSIRSRAHSVENHQRLLEEKKSLRSRLDEQLWAAACLRDYQLSCVQKAFDAEIDQIEREYESERSNLKEKLLGDLLEHRRRLLDNKDGAEEQNGVSTGLGEPEIYEDLDDGAGLARRTRQSANTQNQKSSGDEAEEEALLDRVSVRGDRLYCANESFTKGDTVVLGSPDSSELIGTVTSITPKEIWIRIDDGAKLKITCKQLRSGRPFIGIPGRMDTTTIHTVEEMNFTFSGAGSDWSSCSI